MIAGQSDGLSDHIANVLRNTYVSGVIGNLIAAALLAAVAITIYVAFRRRKLKFFGLSSTRSLVIYTARLNIVSGGALALDGLPRSYSGVASPDTEVRAAGRISTFLSAGLPGFFARAGTDQFRWADLRVSIEPSPALPTEVNGESTLYVLGSPAYNAASMVAEAMPETIGRFTADMTRLDHPNAAVVGVHWAFAQRIVTKGQTIFYAAGPTAPGTVEGGEHLVRNWRHLAKKYGHDRTFCVVLQMNDAGRYLVIHESP